MPALRRSSGSSRIRPPSSTKTQRRPFVPCSSPVRRPSRIVTTRVARSAARGSWVASRTVACSSCASCLSSSRIARPVAASSWPVTSSTSSSLGWTAIATHSAARCCSPPESSARLDFSRPSRPTRSSSSLARLLACLRLIPASRARSAIRAPTAWSSPSALRASWATAATVLARCLASSRGLASSSRVPYTNSSPAVTGCRPARHASSVDLPEPLGPITATSSPGSACSDAPWSETTLPVADSWTTNSLRASIAASLTGGQTPNNSFGSVRCFAMLRGLTPQ